MSQVQNQEYVIIVEELKRIPTGTLLYSDYRCLVCREIPRPINNQEALREALRELNLDMNSGWIDRETTITVDEEFRPIVSDGQVVRRPKYTCIEYYISKRIP